MTVLLSREEAESLTVHPERPPDWLSALESPQVGTLLIGWLRAHPERRDIWTASSFIQAWAKRAGADQDELIRLWTDYLADCKDFLLRAGSLTPYATELESDVVMVDLMAQLVADGLAAPADESADEVIFTAMEPEAFQRFADALRQALDAVYATFLDELDIRLNEFRQSLVSEWAEANVDRNRRIVDALSERAVEPYYVCAAQLFIGSDSPSELFTYYMKYYPITSTGFVRVKRSALGPGALVFTEAASGDHAAIKHQVRLFSKKEIRFSRT